MLTLTQRACLRAALDRIIPPGDGFAGAAEAGVLDYLLGQFERDLSGALPMYRSGLDALDAEARASGASASFAELLPSAQDALLARVETGDVAAKDAWENEPTLFFRKLVEHAHEGYWADPGNGGNKNEVSWKMIGFKVTA